MKDYTKENNWVHDMVIACKQDPNSTDINGVALYHVIDLIRRDEREACAAICEPAPSGDYFAAAIRARGNE